VEKLIAAVEELKRKVDIPTTIKDAMAEQGIGEEFFMAHVEEMADRAFDDQCTGANPRYPLIADLKHLMVVAYTEPALRQ
jgi:acetaldehyde dehydrogenase/alcohol dehydrogenase